VEAQAFVQAEKGEGGEDFTTVAAVLDGVRDILSERWAEDAVLVQSLREWLWADGLLQSRLAPGRNEDDPEVAKFRDYFDYAEPIGRVPSHRALAVFRGRQLEILDARLALPEAAVSASASPQRRAAPEQGVAPLGGSGPREAGERGGFLPQRRAAPEQGTAPSGGSGPRAAGERGGFLPQRRAAPEQGAAPLGGSGPREAGERGGLNPAESRIARHLGWSHQGRAADDLLRKCVAWTWRVKLSLSSERDLFARLREGAEQVAIKVFADNLRDLLLAAPAGQKVVMGLDPGIRTGVKVAVVDATGKLIDTATVYPYEPRRDWDGALQVLAGLVERHRVQLIAIGNGTASRETDRLAGELIRQLQQAGAAPGASTIEKVVISEAGASVYSASEYASQELPDVDVSLRGAASIARRLQDPLAELVKIDPRSIGVGQYQHDVNQGELARMLDAVVEDCVNGVGVDLNTASTPLLARVSGLSPAVARAVVRWREQHGAFRNRQQLLEVSGLGPRTFEQSAGFLRIRGGDNPLDLTGVHPETYPVVEQIIVRAGRPVEQLLGRTELLRSLQPEQFATAAFGAVTVRDILAELEKPGRDPRPDFRVARFNDGVEGMGDLQAGMLLEGTVSNVAAFGAFVDLGVHQDGLVHVSQLANRFVRDAREIVRTGQIVKVRVLEVDVARRRISLTMRLDAEPVRRDAARENRFEAAGRDRRGGQGAARGRAQPPATTMASAFEKLKEQRR
jgi:uncharacterized protein